MASHAGPLFRVLVLGALFTRPASAALPPFDFTGTWSGTATSRGQSDAVTATFSSTGPKTFIGSVTLESVATCQVKGTYGRPVKLHLTCPDGKETLLTHLNPTAETLKGAFYIHHHRQRVKFTLTKSE